MGAITFWQLLTLKAATPACTMQYRAAYRAVMTSQVPVLTFYMLPCHGSPCLHGSLLLPSLCVLQWQFGAEVGAMQAAFKANAAAFAAKQPRLPRKGERNILVSNTGRQEQKQQQFVAVVGSVMSSSDCGSVVDTALGCTQAFPAGLRLAPTYRQQESAVQQQQQPANKGRQVAQQLSLLDVTALRLALMHPAWNVLYCNQHELRMSWCLCAVSAGTLCR